jgi:hypothetical protein
VDARSNVLIMFGTPGMVVASLICGSIALGVFIYGLRQRSVAPMLGGALTIAAGYFLETALQLYLVSAALLAGTWWLSRRDD